MNLSDIYRANGPTFTIAFIILSVAGVGLVIYRYLRNHFDRTAKLEDFLNGVEDRLDQADVAGARQMCEEEPGIISGLMVTAFDHADRGKVTARNAMISKIRQEILPSLTAGMTWILFVIKVAPMVGLLGTVAGMILAFQKIAGATKVNPSELADAIGMALFTTYEGLVIAILVLFFYTHLRGRLQAFEIDLQFAADRALDMLPKMRGGTSP